MNAGRRIGIASIPLSAGDSSYPKGYIYWGFSRGEWFRVFPGARAAEAIFNAEGNPALPAKAEFPRHYPKYPGRQAYI